MKLAVTVLGLLLWAGSARAACTYAPVKMSEAPTNKDDGTSPGMIIYVNGTGYWAIGGPETVDLPAGSIYAGYLTIYGYVDVFALFGGCTDPWSYEISSYIQIYDVTENWKVVYSTGELGGVRGSGCDAGSCAFTDHDDRQDTNLVLIRGHRYVVYGWARAFVPTDNAGFSPWYPGFVTINAT